MTGLSTPIIGEIRRAFLPISIRSGETTSYNINHLEFQRSADASDDQLMVMAEEVLKIFRIFERKINRAVRDNQDLEQALTVDEATFDQEMENLIKWGRRTYRLLFNERAREELAFNLQAGGSMAPTFISEVIPFPWEVLYEGGRYKVDGDPEKFWGFRYAVSRILKPGLSLFKHVLELLPPSRMLFCLHHKLQHAKLQEWPKVKDLLAKTPDPTFLLLSKTMCAEAASLEDGEDFLAFLDKGEHNMLHFAVHCRPTEAGADALLLSVLESHDDIKEDERIIELETGNFIDVEGKFKRQPLVFLNACQSGPSPNDLNKTYNLPQKFIERGAGSVIATACPVPDVFAAEFARVFYHQFLVPLKETDSEGREGLRSKTIGEALKDTRKYFLDKYNNPLGLAYGLYSPAFYRLPEPKKRDSMI